MQGDKRFYVHCLPADSAKPFRVFNIENGDQPVDFVSAVVECDRLRKANQASGVGFFVASFRNVDDVPFSWLGKFEPGAKQ